MYVPTGALVTNMAVHLKQGRENSLVTLQHYTQVKSVYVEMGDVEAPY